MGTGDGLGGEKYGYAWEVVTAALSRAPWVWVREGNQGDKTRETKMRRLQACLRKGRMLLGGMR